MPPTSSLREELIPTAHAYPYDDLLDDCRHYLELTGRRVSFEYILLGELNDHPEHAAELADRWVVFKAMSTLLLITRLQKKNSNVQHPEDRSLPSRVRAPWCCCQSSSKPWPRPKCGLRATSASAPIELTFGNLHTT